ncbi:DNA / pantothenate metabolism flavoprotein, putative [Babesia bigemina]|uniref:DNA / pantothenate metabolism flavoprotein, putative n=1 Tax=Babesia bigemina TaxID=5866 RepID=A0A061D8C6_BABBI|nr:DNA / pantothenate metabolism flavoprotein, putative [Babesia bigemina]CDR96946.1 DNA / pantothenate metabolism flavoprotein, putative [Babesia bigemina]|eukprot:XP_012769132.1 DNA / pantothenate metabolism flavoprotein, putative [Babesia bigemina]
MDLSDYKDKLVVLKFRTMWEYRNVIEQLSHDTKHLGANVIWFLTAAVMDFEIPDAQMPQNKVPSNAPMNITLMPTPKIRNIVRGIIGKAPTMCCFKLETDPNVLIQRAKVLLDEPTMADAVVANILDQRYDRVEIVFPDSTSKKIDAKKESIEKEIVDALIQVHHRKASRC